MHNPVYVVMRYSDNQDDQMDPSIEKVFSHLNAAREYIDEMGFNEDNGPENHDVSNAMEHYVSNDNEDTRIALFEVEIAIGEEDVHQIKPVKNVPVITKGTGKKKITLTSLKQAEPVSKPKSPPKPVAPKSELLDIDALLSSAPVSKPKSPPKPVAPISQPTGKIIFSLDSLLLGNTAPVSKPVAPKSELLDIDALLSSAPTSSRKAPIPSTTQSPDIIIVRSGDNFLVSGSTTSRRTIIKEKLSGVWSASKRVWVVPSSVGISEQNIRNILQ